MTNDTNTSDSEAPDEPEATAGELARRCGRCGAVLEGAFFVQGAVVVCPTCAAAIEKRLAGRGRFRRALLSGGLAAMLLASLWYLATLASSRPLAGVAVLVGVVIGLAVHWGAERRGGLRYQIAAALLVYVAFVARFVPPVFGGIADAIKRQHATALKSPSEPPAATGPSPAPAPLPGGTTASPEKPASRTSGLATLKAYFVFTAVAWGLVLASPFLPGSLGVLPLLCLGLGMAVAVGLNRRVRLRGPFDGGGP